jgi:hypothetical protein
MRIRPAGFDAGSSPRRIARRIVSGSRPMIAATSVTESSPSCSWSSAIVTATATPDHAPLQHAAPAPAPARSRRSLGHPALRVGDLPVVPAAAAQHVHGPARVERHLREPGDAVDDHDGAGDRILPRHGLPPPNERAEGLLLLHHAAERGAGRVAVARAAAS